MIIATKGRSHLLLRTPKQKNERKKNISLYKDEEDKLEEESKEVESLKDEIKNLTQQLKKKEEEIKDNEKYGDLLSDLFQKGIIDEEGNFINDQQDF